jgi:choline transport protein
MSSSSAIDNIELGGKELWSGVKVTEQPLTEVPTGQGSVLPGPSEDLATSRQNHFNLWSCLGINYSTIATPLSIGTYLAFNIGVGGSPVYIFGYLVATIFQIIVCISLAEMAAAFPHSTGECRPEILSFEESNSNDGVGQVYWASVFAPSRYSRILSYWTGAFTVAAWFCWTMGCYLFASQLLLVMVEIGQAHFTEQPYQIYLCYVAAAAFSILLNIHLFKGYSLVIRAMMAVVNVGSVLVFVVLLVRASPKRSAYTVFIEFDNATGWSSDGFVFFLGLLPGITGTNGFDSSAHVTDELPDPARQVPKVMVGTALVAGISGLPMVITFMFCVVNEGNLLTPVGGQPIAQLFLDSTRSTSLTLLLMFVYVFVYYIACGALTTTLSRVLWSLANERHVFMSPWLSKITARRQLPENSIYFGAIFACLIGLLCLGPSTALNAILGSAAICFFVSYMIPIACVLVDRSTLTYQPHYMDLGYVGIVLNWVAMAWMAVMSVILCFPQYLPVTTALMNYSIAVIGGVILIFGLNWVFYARTRYQPPTAAHT